LLALLRKAAAFISRAQDGEALTEKLTKAIEERSR
jgi:hypothetical protein